MNKHTPGPWLRDGATLYTLRGKDKSAENAWQAQFSQDGRYQTPLDEVIASATLAQAAPELLTALENLLDDHLSIRDTAENGDDPDLDSVVRHARAAIAKARGLT